MPSSEGRKEKKKWKMKKGKENVGCWGGFEGYVRVVFFVKQSAGLQDWKKKKKLNGERSRSSEGRQKKKSERKEKK